ncbi:MAG: hypothetical protein JWN71_4349 [Xanthobacteraceae bacterium]|nr:hypothetical protein [Xanthobacteraceae bacterium]
MDLTALRPLALPWPLQGWLDGAARALLEPDGGPRFDLSQPHGEPALVPPDSVSWRVFKNPLALFVGGVTAVILELAEPRVRSGVWEHSSFRSDPVTRLRRTGQAAMITVYGPRSAAQAMIAGVRKRHGGVRGVTPGGVAYEANDPDLLNWVQATAAFGFLEAYRAYVRSLNTDARDRYYAEGAAAARLYGATSAPTSEPELNAMFAATRRHLEASPIVFEFLAIMRAAPVLPWALRPVQAMLVRAAVDLVPADIRAILGLEGHGLRPWERALLRRAGGLADRLVIQSAPAAQACRRLGLPTEYLYTSRQ